MNWDFRTCSKYPKLSYTIFLLTVAWSGMYIYTHTYLSHIYKRVLLYEYKYINIHIWEYNIYGMYNIYIYLKHLPTYINPFPSNHLCFQLRKPHFGNAPRLTAHLAVIAPEPLRSGGKKAVTRNWLPRLFKLLIEVEIIRAFGVDLNYWITFERWEHCIFYSLHRWCCNLNAT